MKKYKIKFEKSWLETINTDATAVVACQYCVDDEKQLSCGSGTKIIVYKHNMDVNGNRCDNWDFKPIVKISQNGFIPLDNKDEPHDKAIFLENAISNGEDDDCNTIDAYYSMRDDFDSNDCQNLVDNFIEQIVKKEKDLT